MLLRHGGYHNRFHFYSRTSNEGHLFPQGGHCGEVQLYLQSVVPQNSPTCLYEIFPTLLVDPVKEIVIQAKTFLPFDKL